MFGRPYCPALFLIAFVSHAAPADELFVAQPGQILRLTDCNSDGDYFDFVEKKIHATGLPSAVGALVWKDPALYVLGTSSATIYRVRDLNGDGDALDFAEVSLFAQLIIQPTPALVGLAISADGALLTLDSVSGTLYRIADLNGDGDALDAGEILQIGSNLSNPLAITVRPGGALLVALQSATVPVRILRDLNADGDYFDFAENISYAESIAAGNDLAAVDLRTAFMTRAAEGRVIKLQDLTGDDDVLDVAEIIPLAEGLPAPAKIVLAADGDVLIACQNPDGSIYRLHDLNDDGDALDFAETLVIADGVTQVGGMVFVASPIAECLKGDVDGNSTVNTADIPPMVDILLGNVNPPDPCPADTNNDGLLDGRDIRPFIALALPSFSWMDARFLENVDGKRLPRNGFSQKNTKAP